jgi:hypothetical protein
MALRDTGFGIGLARLGSWQSEWSSANFAALLATNAL